MEVQLVKIDSGKNIPLSIKELYFSSFPEEERRPWSDIEALTDGCACDFNFYILQGNLQQIGFMTLWKLPNAIYCEHLAIDPAFRGGGFGAQAVAHAINIAHNTGLPLILEVELPEASDMARRRIGFYERCGMKALRDFTYIQPPYSPGLPSVPLMLMTSHDIIDPAPIAANLHKYIYNIK